MKLIPEFLKNRYLYYYLPALGLMLFFMFYYPPQAQVVLWKLCLLYVSITVGIHLSRAAIILPLQRRCPQMLDNATVSAAICIARSIVIMACVIAMCLGV